MTGNSLQQELIDELMRKTGDNVSKVARQLGLDYSALREKTRAAAGILSFPRATTPEPDDIRTLGKPGFERYVVAVKPRGEGWPAKYAGVIAEMRKRFDAGTVDMYQTNNGGWVVQYCIPLINPRRSSNFFPNMVVMR